MWRYFNAIERAVLKPSVPLVQQACNRQVGSRLSKDLISTVGTLGVSQDATEASPVNLDSNVCSPFQSRPRM